jgi:hypothetical protein
VVQVAGELVKFLLTSFNSLAASSTSFAPAVAEIAFVPAEPPLAPDGLTDPRCALAGAGKGGAGGGAEERLELLRFSDVAMPADRHLVWSVRPVLHAATVPNEVTRLQLGVVSPPHLGDVVAHLAALPADIPARWPLPEPPAAVYQKTLDFLATHWAKLAPEEAEKLRSTACVPVGDLLVKPARIFFRLALDLSPFIFQVPRCFGAQEGVLKRLGARERPSPRDLTAFLRDLGAECRGAPLNPNELVAVAKVLESVTEAHAGAAAAGLLVPDVAGRLVPARACFRCCDRRLVRRVDRARVHLVHPALSASTCAAAGVRPLAEALDERLDRPGDLLLAHSPLEAALAARLHSPRFAEAVEAIADSPDLSRAAAADALRPWRVQVARQLRTRLFLRGSGGGDAPPAEPGEVTSPDGLDVLFFVDRAQSRVLIAAELPLGVEAHHALAAAVSELLGGRLAAELLAVGAALAAEPEDMLPVLERLGVRRGEDHAAQSRGVAGAPVLPVDQARLTVQPRKRFAAGEVVVVRGGAGTAGGAGGAEALSYGVVVGVDADDEGGEADAVGVKRLSVRVGGGEVLSVLSAAVMCFKPTSTLQSGVEGGAEGARVAPLQDAGGEELRLPGVDDKGAGAGAGAGGAVPEGGPVSSRELTAAVVDLLARLEARARPPRCALAAVACGPAFGRSNDLGRSLAGGPIAGAAGPARLGGRAAERGQGCAHGGCRFVI